MVGLRFSKNTRVLSVVAHPDDETLFAGGFLSSFKDNAFVLCVSHGLGEATNASERSVLRRTRALEFKRATKTLGVKSRILDCVDKLNYEDKLLSFSKDYVENLIFNVLKDKIEEYFLRIKPDLVLTHNSFGEYGHFLHRTVHRLVVSVAKNFFDKGFNFRLLTFAPKLKILNIKTGRWLNTKHNSVDYKFVLNDRVFSVKEKALSCYKSQLYIMSKDLSRERLGVEGFHLYM